MFNFDRDQLSFVDNAWLRMDRPYNLMTINCVMILEDRMDLEHFQKTIETRLLTRERFRQRPVQHTTGTYWETDTHFEISSHVRRIGLPGAGGKQELEEFVSNLVSTPMDPTKPLWDVHLVEDYQEGSASIWRFHHCYADGVALIHILLSIIDLTPDAATPKTRTASRKSRHHDEDESVGDIFHQLFHPVSEAVSHAVKAGRDLLEEGVDIVLHPAEMVDYARQGWETLAVYARQGLGFASEAARLLFLPDDPDTRLRGRLGVAKRVAWADPLPLSEVKLIGRAFGCTLNDVLLASVAGALHAYLVEKGDPVVEELEIRAAVPVNLRSSDDPADDMGNVFGLVLLTLPIGIENPLERLYQVHRRMGELKASYQAVLTFGLLEIMGLGPKAAQAAAIKLISRKATTVMTNVPGPPQPLYFAGSKISALMFWVPQAGSVGMGVSILTYNHHVHFGLITDRKLIRDPETIISQFRQEFEKLLLIAMMGPWDKHSEADSTAETEKALAR